MYEFEIVNRETGEVLFLYGYDLNDGFRRRPDLNRSEWALSMVAYID